MSERKERGKNYRIYCSLQHVYDEIKTVKWRFFCINFQYNNTQYYTLNVRPIAFSIVHFKPQTLSSFIYNRKVCKTENEKNLIGSKAITNGEQFEHISALADYVLSALLWVQQMRTNFVL